MSPRLSLIRVVLATTAALITAPCHAQVAPWQPFPAVPNYSDFGSVGLIQTPTARMASDGTLSFTANRVWPYERYTVGFQVMPWIEAGLRYTSVANRLYSSVPEFSGDQSFKDRGFDLKIRVLEEGRVHPAVAIGLRDFVGTGIFSGEYVVANKSIGPLDASIGVGWGNLGTRGHLRNPLCVVSDSLCSRAAFEGQGGDFSQNYFRGDRVALFGGLKYQTPIRGLSVVAEYDPNNYQREALQNNLRSSFPVNVGLSYNANNWLQLAGAWERGNKIGLRMTMRMNLHSRVQVKKIDPGPPDVSRNGDETAAQTPAGLVDETAATGAAAVPSETATARDKGETSGVTPPPIPSKGEQLAFALGDQGAGLLWASLDPQNPRLYVAQGRFRDPTVGLGRIARAAFAVLPASTKSVEVVFIEAGLQTVSVTLYRDQFLDAIDPAKRDTDTLWMKSVFAQAEGDPPTDYVSPGTEFRPRTFYGIRPGLRQTLGRPEKFILYQAWVRLHAAIDFRPGLVINGSLGINISNNFDQIRNGSDSVLPRVRSDIGEYLKRGETAITQLVGDYYFTLGPALYGHVYAGLIEEMYGGVGGEVLYRPFDSNLAVGFDLNWVKQRGFNGYFGFRNYSAVTGHATVAYNFPGPNITAKFRIGQYLAGDRGVTIDLSRTFRSGARVGAFATFTNVSAADFGEGSFDKGIYITVPMDLFYARNVRQSIGFSWRPLLRDGGQELNVGGRLIDIMETMTLQNFRYSWKRIGD